MVENLQEHLNTETKKDIEHLYKHAEVANREMGIIKTDVDWIKKKLEKVDSRSWWILGTVILGIAMQVVLNMI